MSHSFDDRSRGRRVLVIDDSRIDREHLMHAIRTNVPLIEIAQTNKFADARKLAAERQPDFCFVDYCMPEGFGSDLAVDLVANCGVVIGLSGGENDEVRLAFAKAGVIHTMCKSDISPDAMLHLFEQWVGCGPTLRRVGQAEIRRY